MSTPERYKQLARDFLLRGGAGFEGTPAASTFGFEGVIECMVSWRIAVESEADNEMWTQMWEADEKAAYSQGYKDAITAAAHEAIDCDEGSRIAESIRSLPIPEAK